MPEYGQPAGNGQKILEYIEKHFTEQSLSLGELSDHFHLSESYLTRLIKRETGCAFSEVLTKHRIGHAISLLKQYPDMKLVEVAERTGFASQHYFPGYLRNRWEWRRRNTARKRRDNYKGQETEQAKQAAGPFQMKDCRLSYVMSHESPALKSLTLARSI